MKITPIRRECNKRLLSLYFSSCMEYLKENHTYNARIKVIQSNG